MPDEHDEESQRARAARLREQIERLKKGEFPEGPKSLREQIEEHQREKKGEQ